MTREAINIAIAALKAEPCEDAVSREAVLNYIRDNYRRWFINDDAFMQCVNGIKDIVPATLTFPTCEDAVSRIAVIELIGDYDLSMGQAVKGVWALPSVTPEQRWIPVTERLPEDGEDVLVWYEYFRYGEYNCMYQTYGIGYQYDGHWGGSVSGTKAKCIAWMPLPEPYKAESEDKK